MVEEVPKPYSRILVTEKGVSEKITGSFTPNFTPTPGHDGDAEIFKVERPTSLYATLENPFRTWSGAVEMINSLIYGPVHITSGGGVDEIVTVDKETNYLSPEVGDQEANPGHIDGNLWLGPSTMALPAKEHIWTKQDIIKARNYRRKLMPEIIFKKIPRIWQEATLIDLLKPWWVYQNFWRTATDTSFVLQTLAGWSDRPGMAAPSTHMQITGQQVIDLEDEQGPFHYAWTMNAAPTADALLGRWNLEDIFEDEDNPLERGKTFPPLLPAQDLLPLPPGTINTLHQRRFVLCNGLDGIVQDFTASVGS